MSAAEIKIGHSLSLTGALAANGQPANGNLVDAAQIH